MKANNKKLIVIFIDIIPAVVMNLLFIIYAFHPRTPEDLKLKIFGGLAVYALYKRHFVKAAINSKKNIWDFFYSYTSMNWALTAIFFIGSIWLILFMAQELVNYT